MKLQFAAVIRLLNIIKIQVEVVLAAQILNMLVRKHRLANLVVAVADRAAVPARIALAA